MKLILLIVISFFFIGCVSKKDFDSQNDSTSRQIDDLKNQLRSTNQTVDSLLSQLNQSVLLISTLRFQVASLQESDNNNEIQVELLDSMIQTLQSLTQDQQRQITELQTKQTVVGIIDFCGQTPGVFNEVGLRLADGSTVAFFESNNNRFLSVLKTSTSYRTTDGTNCNFSVDASGRVCDSLGCF